VIIQSKKENEFLNSVSILIEANDKQCLLVDLMTEETEEKSWMEIRE
jgi:hypothetical protein